MHTKRIDAPWHLKQEGSTPNRMLADILRELTPQLVRRVEAGTSACPHPERAENRCTPERVPALIGQLIQALQTGRVDVSPCQSQLKLGLDIPAVLLRMRVLRGCVYDLIEERGIQVHVRDMRVLADWFGALTEMALREENRRFQAMLDALPDHLVLVDASGRLVYMNRSAGDAAAAFSDLPREQLIGRTQVELGLPANFIDESNQVIERVRRGEQISNELRFPGPDGGHWREQHAAPVFDASGRVEAVAVASRDIHARKIAEARLQLLSKVGTLAETTDYQGVLSAVARLSIPELADWCIIDIVEDGQVRRGKVAHRDPAKTALAEEILRTSPRPLGLSVLSGRSHLVAEVDPAELRLRGGDAPFYDIVRRLGARSVMVIPFVVLGTPVAIATFVTTPESGRRHGPEDLALAEELARRAAQIIENARLHQQLRQSEARFRVALEHSNIAVFEEDADFRLRWMHNAQLGASPGDPPTGDPLPFDGVEGAEALTALKRKVFETGEGARTAVDALVRGERRHLLVNYEPLRDVHGVVGLTGAAVDITDAKRAQEELARALAFREQMMGVLGHDLRNPLSAVLALAGLLKRNDNVPEKVHEGLSRIEHAAQRMTEMIGTLLDFTLLRARGELPITVEPVDLDVLVRSVIDELRVAHPRREIRIETRGDVRGHWDPARMAQVVSNLVGNALTHGARDAEVELSLAADDAHVTLAVTNRGPAIPEELVERLFEPFLQGPNHGDLPRARGLGLGLFIVRQIVAAHGGTTQVRSVDDATTFTVRLQRAA